LTIDRGDYEIALREAAHRVVPYQAARWALGYARRSLPPTYELRTRGPDDELDLPADLSEPGCREWAWSQARAFSDRVRSALARDSVTATFDSFSVRLRDALGDVQSVLLWFSGKDLMAGLSTWLQRQGVAGPGLFRRKLCDGISLNPERALRLLPEWDALVQTLRA
jgi:hypothetical protein